MEKDNQFSYLNFFYGLGATVILIAAMFKFLGWRYANIIFVIGILVEAIVFLISAFDWSGGRKNYEWEKVFPQLKEEDDLYDITTPIAEGTQQQQIQKIMDTIVALNNSVNELNSATKKLTSSVNTMEENYDSITESTKRYQAEIDHLSSKISRANDSLSAFDNFNYQRQKLD
jgi:peptidoglycan hydrolase CwlO-like protein